MLKLLGLEARILHGMVNPTVSDAELVSMLKEGPSWTKLMWLAQNERAEAALWHRLSALQDLELPAEADQLQTITMVSDFRMEHLRGQVIDALRVLGDAGMDALLLKGSGLALTVYGSFPERPMIDVDLLAAPGRALDTWEALRDAGWKPLHIRGLDRDFREEHHHHMSHLAEPSGTGVTLEVHTGLFVKAGPFLLESEDLWRDAHQHEVEGQRFFTPSTAHQIIHLSIHFAWSHLMDSAAWRTFRDIRMLIEAGLVNWNDVIQEAERVRATTCCYWTLRLARDVQGVDVPDWVLESTAPPGAAWRLTQLARGYVACLSPLNTNVCPSVVGFRYLWKAGIRPKWSRHEGLLPWEVLEREAEAKGEAGETPAGVLEQLSRFPAWCRFLGTTIIGMRSS